MRSPDLTWTRFTGWATLNDGFNLGVSPHLPRSGQNRNTNPFKLQGGLTIQLHRINWWIIITVWIIGRQHGIQCFIQHIITFTGQYARAGVYGAW